MNQRQPKYGDWAEKLAQEARLLGESRMIRDEQALTPEITAAVIERFQAYIKRAGKSAEWAARSLGIGAATLSQVLSGSYPADAEKHIRAIDKWIEGQIRKEAAPKPAGFVKTGVAEQIYGVARWMCEIGGIGVVHGPPGIGKTLTLQAIRAEMPGSIYISINSAGRRCPAVLEALTTALRASGLRMTASQYFQQLTSILADTGRLILVDEVHKLVGREHDAALHVLRDLHDATHCPMVWAGNTAIYDYLRRGKTRGHDPLEQISGRIAFWLDLEAVANRSDGGEGLYTIADIQKVFASSKMRLTPDAQRYLQMLANAPTLGGLRTCKDLVLMAQKVIADGPIDSQVLRSILSQKFGERVADQAEQEMQTHAAVAVA